MNIFEKRSAKYKNLIRILLPLFLLVLICSVFVISFNKITTETTAREQATLEQALRHGAVHTYALTGQYPESLSELLTEYHITYDQERFIVDYTPNGSNLFPMIFVLPRTSGKGGLS